MTTSPSTKPTSSSHAFTARKLEALRARNGTARRTVGLILTTTVAMAATQGCNADPSDSPAPATPSTTPETTSTASVSQLAAAVNKMAPKAPVELTLRTLPSPPAGFTKAELEAFGQRLIDLVERGISPELEGMTPQEAFDYVFAHQLPESTKAARDATSQASGDYRSEWAWASLFDVPPSEPARVLAARWQVSTSMKEIADGTTRPRLELALSVAIEHLVNPGTTNRLKTESPGHETELPVPIVMKRTITIRGFEPLGGREWWPAIGIQATPLLGGKCAPINGSILTPATDQQVLRTDLSDLRKFLRSPRKIDTSATSQAADIAEYVDKFCESE